MDTTLRIYSRDAKGRLEDNCLDISLKDTGGVVPQIGDVIVDPSCKAGLSRDVPRNRTLWLVTERFFYPKGSGDYVVLVVEARRPTAGEMSVVI